MTLNRKQLALILFGSAIFQACNASANGTAAAPSTPAPAAASQPQPAAQAAQAATDSETLKLALKYVEFTDPSNKPPLTQDAAKTVTDGINQLYAQCKIQFQLEEYLPVAAESQGLQYSTQSMAELDPIRGKFDSADKLVVINTGPWDHGSMGSANAWTTMPGQSPSGAVIEAPVADFANIVAHELGHYLSLDHVSDKTDLMNPIIYNDSTRLDASQCAAMRDSARKDRPSAVRT